MKNIRFFLASFILFLCWTSLSYSAYLDLAWNPNEEADLAGYRVYYGTSPGNYGSPIDVGNVTTHRLNGLNDGMRYYIALTAYDTSNNESTKSIEINGIPYDTQKPTVTISVPTSSSAFITSSSTVAVAGSATDNLDVTEVTWVNNRGGAGTAIGTDSWAAAAITLLEGSNIITVTAYDAAYNTGTDSITITYIPPTTSTSSSNSTVASTSTTTILPTTTTTAPPTTTTTPVTTTLPPSTSTSTVQPTTTTTAPPTTTTTPVTTTLPSSTSTSSIMATTTTTSIDEEIASCEEPKKLLPLSLSASSELRPFFGIDNLVDGNPQTAWSTLLSLFRKDASIIMDMGSRKIITSLSMYASSLFGIDVLPSNIELQLSNDNINWETINSASFSRSLQPPYADSWQINNHPCQYIKICVTGRNSFFFFQFARIAELEIYGCDQTADPPVADESNAWSETAVLNTHNRTQSDSACPIESMAPGIPGKPLVTFN